MIQVFKMFKGIDQVRLDELFMLNGQGSTRGHEYKIFKMQVRSDMRKNFFSCRVVDQWNGLPSWVVNENTVRGFKSKLDKHWGAT